MLVVNSKLPFNTLSDPGVQKHITDMNIEPVVGTRAQMAAVILEEIERWKPEVEAARSK